MYQALTVSTQGKSRSTTLSATDGGSHSVGSFATGAAGRHGQDLTA